jgi:L-lactate dehydrogenase (cytochrome)
LFVANASEPIHAPGVLEETLPPEKCLGPVDLATVEHAPDDKDHVVVADTEEIPPVHQVINIEDFAVIRQ